MAGERSHEARRPRRPVFLALAALGLLGVVALAARRHAPVGGGGATRHVPGNLILEYLLLLLVAEALIVMPFLAWTMWTNRYERARRRKGTNWMPRVFAVMVIACLFLGAVYAWRAIHGGSPSRRGTRTSTVTPPTVPGNGRQGDATFDWLPAVVVGSLLLVGVGAALFAFRRLERPGKRSDEDLAEELSHVLDDTLDDLRAEPDPRRAVIAAYARMERALAWFGLPRRIFEAPLEYLARVLVELHASTDSVRRLTSLFERAKFSTHAIGPRLKEDAIEALVAVRDELRAYR